MHSPNTSSTARAIARLGLLLLVVVGACDVPTKLPSWDQTWLIPGDSTRVSVSELLHGVHRARGAQQTRRRAVVETILAAFEAVPITEPVARIHAEIWARFSARGSVVLLAMDQVLRIKEIN